ncbi:MAG: CDP-diacylglycerol--serine O-phosphatidyltransferase [Bacteroidales bacterium]|nr:CDP-diacylglycerol--serine O-phosphatidyltransferase [Bacteroidales bacterium]
MKKHIPNSITLLNLISGSVAVILAVEGQMIPAVALVGLAAVFDFLDGFFARLLHVKSEIGKELDSLADVISFGLTPSVILFCLIRENPALQSTQGLAGILPYSAMLIAAFSALRLAKFNLDTRQSTSFLGLPTPANALFIVSLALISGSQALQEAGLLSSIAGNLYFQLALIPLSCYLLVSEIPLFALKFSSGFSFSANKLKYILVLLSTIALIAFQWAGIPMIVILYVVISTVAGQEKF